jgi:hypothetical protein
MMDTSEKKKTKKKTTKMRRQETEIEAEMVV